MVHQHLLYLLLAIRLHITIIVSFKGQRVTYNDGGGTAIGGLSNGVYYIIKNDKNTIKLAASAADATAGSAVPISGLGAGTAHTLNVAFDGVNTKI